MHRPIFLNVAVYAVAATVLADALPAFPLFADETAPSSAVAPADAVYDAVAAFADFDVSLFEIPDGENAAFYRERVSEIAREWSRCVFAHRENLRKAARERGERADAVDPSAAMLDAPLGALTRGGSGAFVPAPLDSVPARRAVALADLYGRLANAPELPLEVRGQYYGKWIDASTASLRDKSPQEKREFYAQLLAGEKAKSPLDLGRVIFLNNIVSHHDLRIKEADATQKPLDREAVEKLLDVPERESVKFYDKRWNELTRADLFLRRQEEKDETLQTRVQETTKIVAKLRLKALDAEAAAFDRDNVKRLFDVPSRENAAFYLARYQETEEVMKQTLTLSNSAKGRDLGRLNARLRDETLPEIAKRLAYADELEPLERFDYFKTWLRFADAEEIRDAIDVETVRDATSEVDACRKLYVKKALADRLLDDAIDETRKSLSESERRFSYSSSDRLPVSPEAQAMFDEAFNEIAKLANGGAIPWSLGSSWSEWAANRALELQNRGYLKIAAQLRKDVRDALADSENETDLRVLNQLERQIRASEIIGSKLPVEGRELNGTTFDWASYRGAPVLFVSGSVERLWAPNGDLNFIPNCVEEGLKVVKYCSDLESAQAQAEHYAQNRSAVLSFQAEGGNLDRLGPDVESRTPFAAFIVPAAGKGGPNDWPDEYGIGWLEFGVLFDADGRVLATSPKTLESENAPEIADELRKLFPKVPIAERK